MSVDAFYVWTVHQLIVLYRSFRFDPKDGEAPSEGEDDEDANGYNVSDGSYFAFPHWILLQMFHWYILAKSSGLL